MCKINKILAVGIVSFVAFSVGSQVSAEPAYYYGASVGVSNNSHDFNFTNPRVASNPSKDGDDNSFVGTIKIGREFSLDENAVVRGEIEYGYTDTAKYSGVWYPFTAVTQELEVKSHRVMVNLAYDIEVVEGIKMFPMAGIGWSHNNADAVQKQTTGDFQFADDWQNNLAWSLGAGISTDVSEGAVIDLSYQYLDLGSADTGISQFFPYDESFNGDLIAHEIKVGVRFAF